MKFRNFWNITKKITRNKNFECELLYSNDHWFLFQLSWTKKHDHAGLEFQIGLFGFSFAFKIYDSRHWDYKENSWMNHRTYDKISSDLT
jgi:hypothetical protein